MKRIKVIITAVIVLAALGSACGKSKGVEVGSFYQQKRITFSMNDGLPSNEIYSIFVANNGNVYAGTAKGLSVFKETKWYNIPGQKKAVYAICKDEQDLVFVTGSLKEDYLENAELHFLAGSDVKASIIIPEMLKLAQSSHLVQYADAIYLAGVNDLYRCEISKEKMNITPLKIPDLPIRQFSVLSNGDIWAATKASLLKYSKSLGQWQSVYPHDEKYSWAPRDVRGVAVDKNGRVWFASPQGVGCFDDSWKLFTGAEGLPFNDFTVVSANGVKDVWFGTTIGAMRYDGNKWEYRQGKRWLPDDKVKDIAVTDNGDAWFATNAGVGLIKNIEMTLAEKAKWYEDEIDRYHRRTPYEYVLEVNLSAAGDKTNVVKHDSDNDGLWTSMYGAGECFAYAVTKDPKAKERADKAFAALEFLGQVTQGGTNPAPPGFVARTILPTSGHNPNDGRLERDRREQQHGDKLWKVIDPRWPVSKDGKWYWKCDTSSDELDGHYFFYGLYYDLVAQTEAEKTRVRKHIKALTDHLVKHDFQLVDHDGKPTRWARFSPKEINYSENWFTERGLNSLSMLSYLAVTEHITGDKKYRKIANELIKKHSYHQNLMYLKPQRGAGSGNQSDDEMAFMCYYNILKYEKNPQLTSRYALSFWKSWRLEQPEMNPFFNFAFAAMCDGVSFKDAWGEHPMDPTGDWLEDSIETLKRFPLDRVDWRHTNSHRLDIIPLPEWMRDFDKGSMAGNGHQLNGKVIPVDECYFNHWNRNPWQLNTGGNGHSMGDGAVFLLPYYMGLYHGFIIEN